MTVCSEGKEVLTMESPEFPFTSTLFRCKLPERRTKLSEHPGAADIIDPDPSERKWSQRLIKLIVEND